MLDRLACIDAPEEAALLATTTARGTEVAVGEARYAGDELRTDAREFALVVVEPWQRMGVGTRLLRELVRLAARSGVGVLYGDIFADNAPMLALARRIGFERRRHPFDARLVRLSWAPTDSLEEKSAAGQRQAADGPLN
jgi:acetyltransferase